MEAVTWLHGSAGLALLGALGALAVGTVVALRVPPLARWADGARRLLLGLLVAQAALGLVIALRGGAPAEGIHWVYGVAVIAVLLMVGPQSDAAATVERDARRRGAFAVAGVTLAVVLAWRLWASG